MDVNCTLPANRTRRAFEHHALCVLLAGSIEALEAVDAADDETVTASRPGSRGAGDGELGSDKKSKSCVIC